MVCRALLALRTDPPSLRQSAPAPTGPTHLRYLCLSLICTCACATCVLYHHCGRGCLGRCRYEMPSPAEDCPQATAAALPTQQSILDCLNEESTALRPTDRSRSAGASDNGTPARHSAFTEYDGVTFHCCRVVVPETVRSRAYRLPYVHQAQARYGLQFQVPQSELVRLPTPPCSCG
jgi:hypothetical protein